MGALRSTRPSGANRRLQARTLSARGESLLEHACYREAEPVLRRALVASERAFGLGTLEAVNALTNLAACYKALARFSEAGPLYQRALGIVERRLGPGHPEVATIYHELGSLEHAAGNWARGEGFAVTSIRIRRGALGPQHPLVASDMLALAALLDRQKKYPQAERLYKRAIAIFERAYGPEHPEIAVGLNNLAAIHQARGRLKQAETLYRRALAMDTAHFGPRHPMVALCTNNLALLLTSRGRPEEAAKLSLSALAIFRRAFGPRHPNVGFCLENYAAVLRALKRRREAAACARRAERILSRIEAVNNDGVAATATINPQYAWFRLIVGPSPVNRFGVFADEPIPSRRRVIEFTGERIARREARRRWDPARSYLFALDVYWRIDGAIGGSGAEYVNHSCAPNLRARKVRGGIFYYSRRSIAKGEELTVDYRYSSNVEPLPCHCGAPTCRGTMNVTRRHESHNSSRRRMVQSHP
jgi:tetratricopeptide (TPR) repeat protein